MTPEVSAFEQLIPLGAAARFASLPAAAPTRRACEDMKMFRLAALILTAFSAFGGIIGTVGARMATIPQGILLGH